MTASSALDLELSVTLGVNITQADNLTTHTVAVRDLRVFIAGHTSHIQDITLGVNTLADWWALDQDTRDKLKIKASYITAGTMSGNIRAKDHITRVGLAILDLDSENYSEYDVAELMHGYCAVYWQTPNSRPDDRRWRIVFPHRPELSAELYAVCVRAYVEALGLSADSCSSVAAQGQMLPIEFDDYAPTIHESVGDILDLTAYAPSNVVALPSGGGANLHTGEYIPAADADAFTEWDKAHTQQVDGLTEDDLREILGHQDPGMKYPEWMRVGAALHHQTGGDENGRALWHEWSMKAGEVYSVTEADRVWDSFDRPRGGAPVTIRSYMRGITLTRHQAETRRQVVGRIIKSIERSSDPDQLEQEIPAEVRDLRGLTTGDRNLMASALQKKLKLLNRNAFGVNHAPPLADIRRAMRPSAAVAPADGPDAVVQDDEDDLPATSWYKEWVYVQASETFYNRRTKRSTRINGFNAEYTRFLPPSLGYSAAQYALVSGPNPIPVVNDTSYLPGRVGSDANPDIVMRAGVWYLNTWDSNSYSQPLDPLLWDSEQYVKDARLLSKYFRLLFRDHRERRIVMAWAAFIAQNPGHRVNWMLLIQGPQGVGKSLLGDLMRASIGEVNVGVVDAHVLGGEFNAWAVGHQLKIVEEIRMPGERGSSFAVVNAIKPLITNETISIHRKRLDPTQVLNVSSYLGLTNYRDAIPIESGDRRYCVIYTYPMSGGDVARILREHPTLYADLYDLINNRPEVVAGLARAFKPTDLWTPFNPKGHAPNTAAKADMKQNAAPQLEQVLNEVMPENSRGINVEKGVLSTAHLHDAMRRAVVDKVPARRINALLLDRGYVRWSRADGRVRWDGDQTRIYINPDNLGTHDPSTADVLSALDDTLTASAAADFNNSTEGLL